MKRLVLLAMLGAGCGVSQCVARGARVRTPRGERPIEDLAAGDEVFAVDPDSGELVATRLTAVVTAQRESVRLAGDGWALVCTSDHPLYDPLAKTWADAGDFVLGRRTEVLRVLDDGRAVRSVVSEREAFQGVHEVFDLTVEHSLHDFVAQSVVVHNKSLPRSCSLDGAVVTSGLECTCPDGTTGQVSCTDSDGKVLAEGTCAFCAPDAGP